MSRPAQLCRHGARPLASLAVLAHCAMWMVQTSCNSAPTSASCGEGGPGFLLRGPAVLAAGVEANVELCLGGAPTLRLEIERFMVRADGLELGETTSDGRCLTVPFRTVEATDAKLHVQAEVHFNESTGFCGDFNYDTSSEFVVRVREPDAVLHFEPSGCDGETSVLLAGSEHAFVYELGADGQPLDYGLEQPPLLVDTGELALQDDGRFKMPDVPGTFSMTSQIEGDDFERTLIAYELDEVQRVEFAVVNNDRWNSMVHLIIRASLEHAVTCDTPPGTVSVEVLTPEVCHLVDDTPTGATTAQRSFGAPLEVAIVDLQADECVLQTTYGDFMGTLSLSPSWR